MNVLIAGDHQLILDTLAVALEAEQDMKVVARCSTIESCVQALEAHTIDVLLLDSGDAAQSAAHYLGRIPKLTARVRVVVLAGDIDDDECVRLAAYRVAGIFLKRNAAPLLLECLRKVVQGDHWFDTECLNAILRSINPDRRVPERRALHKRGNEILRLVVDGNTNKQISEKMGMTVPAVKSALQVLFRVHSVRNRSQLVRMVLAQEKAEGEPTPDGGVGHE